MTYEEKKAWLSRFGSAILKEEYLRDALREAQLDTGHTTQQLSAMPGGGSDGQALPRTVERVETVQQALDAQMMLCDDLHAETLARLEDVENPNAYEVLRLRYLRLLEWEQIAQKMHICLRQVYRLHHRGIDALEL